MQQLEQMLNEWFGQKAPQLPMGLKNFIVAVAPYLTILGVLFGVLGVLALIGFGGLGLGMMGAYGMMGYGSYGAMMIVSGLLLVVTLIFEVMAIPGLFKKSASGWRYVYYATIVSIISSLVNGGIVGAIISALIGFYILFQVRALYNGGAGASMTPPSPSPMV